MNLDKVFAGFIALGTSLICMVELRQLVPEVVELLAVLLLGAALACTVGLRHTNHVGKPLVDTASLGLP